MNAEKPKVAVPARALDVVTDENYKSLGQDMVAEFMEAAQARPEDGWQVKKTIIIIIITNYYINLTLLG